MAVTEEKAKPKTKLSSFEQETIINFNKGEDAAYIFTYEKTWQRHLEKRLGLKPTMDNGYGGREYHIDKKRIKMPRAPKKLSPNQKAELRKRLQKSRKTAILRAKTPNTAIN